MVIGLVGVAQLVPYAIRLNASNRNDSTALVFAQRELVAMADQPLTLLLSRTSRSLVRPALPSATWECRYAESAVGSRS